MRRKKEGKETKQSSVKNYKRTVSFRNGCTYFPVVNLISRNINSFFWKSVYRRCTILTGSETRKVVISTQRSWFANKLTLKPQLGEGGGRGRVGRRALKGISLQFYLVQLDPPTGADDATCKLMDLLTRWWHTVRIITVLVSVKYEVLMGRTLRWWRSLFLNNKYEVLTFFFSFF